METINNPMTRTSYICISVFIYISAFLSFIGALFGVVWFLPFIILMNILGYCLVYKKYRRCSTLSVKDNMNDMVMLYMCKIGGCYLMAFLLAFFMRGGISTYDEMRIRTLTIMAILFAITPSVKKGVRNLQDKYKYSMINKKNSIVQVEEKLIRANGLERWSQKHSMIILISLKKYYSMINTILPVLLLIILYIIPVDDDGYHIYDYMEDFEGGFFAFLFLPIAIIIVNWVYKVFHIRLHVLYVINIVLYALVIINFLIFFAKYEFGSFMLIPMLFDLLMIIFSKLLIDNTTASNTEINT